MSCCFGPVFPLGVIVESLVEIHAASVNRTLQCGVESKEDQSCVSRCCVVSGRGTSMEISHGSYFYKFDGFPGSLEKRTMYSSVDRSQPSVFSRFVNGFRLWLLLGLRYRRR